MWNDRRAYHVVPQARGESWIVAEEGEDTGAQTFNTQAEAIEAAKKLAQGYGPSTLTVYRVDGSVELKCAYERDPLIEQLADYGF